MGQFNLPNQLEWDSARARIEIVETRHESAISIGNESLSRLQKARGVCFLRSFEIPRKPTSGTPVAVKRSDGCNQFRNAQGPLAPIS
jgi:hypothetical protein